MKRDNQLIIKILKWIDKPMPDRSFSSISIDPYPESQVTDHLILMIEEDLLEGKISHIPGQKTPNVTVEGITAKGRSVLTCFPDNTDFSVHPGEFARSGGESFRLEEFIPKEGVLSPERLEVLTSITRLASGDSQDKSEAIEIFKRERSFIPDNFAEEFIRIMGLDDTEKVSASLIPTENGEITKIIRQGFCPNPDIIEKYYDSLDLALKKVSDIARVFDLSHSTAEGLKNSLSDSDKPYTKSQFSDFLREHKKIFPLLQLFPQNGLPASPIGLLSSVIKTLPESRKNGTSPVFTSTEKDTLKRQLDEIVVADKDISFNVAGYELLYTLERMMRDLIHQRIMVPHAKSLDSKIPSSVLKEMERRKDIEEKNSIVEGNYELIEYCDFTHLKEILEKGRNKNEFKDIFSESEMMGVFTKLGELDPIRKKIAHSRPLTRREFERLKLYASDILHKLKK